MTTQPITARELRTGNLVFNPNAEIIQEVTPMMISDIDLGESEDY